MADTFITSDPHFGHENILSFTREDGSLCRDFPAIDEMNETIIARHNEIVKPQDKVYILGDIAMKKRFIPLVGRMNGHKRLVRGNHDIFRTKLYMEFFEEVYAYRKLEDFFLSHIPLHPASLRYNWINVHGHLHNNLTNEQHQAVYGPRYILVSPELLSYSPLAFDQLREIARSRGLSDYRMQREGSEHKTQQPEEHP